MTVIDTQRKRECASVVRILRKRCNQIPQLVDCDLAQSWFFAERRSHQALHARLHLLLMRAYVIVGDAPQGGERWRVGRDALELQHGGVESIVGVVPQQPEDEMLENRH